jgi:ribonuclease Z
MAELIILGTASAVPDAMHENTHMLLRDAQSTVLIDCVGRPLVSLKRVDVGVEDVGDLILTHFHPDHVGAVPNLMMASWLIGRTSPLNVYGLDHCITRVEDSLTAFGWENWLGFFPVSFHTVPEREGVLVLENEVYRITASPVCHYVPTMGLRTTTADTGFVLAYSSDTMPCAETVRLAAGADLLIHEATGHEPLGHSSAAQAGEIARQAGVRRLGLIHYNVWEADPSHLIDEAASVFGGEVFLCEDFQRIELRRSQG